MTVYLVGAGPGDPGLLTRRGAELLARADVVVHDRLGTADLLALARPDAELISAGKAPGQVDLTQDEINALLVERGQAGLEVVRLKGELRMAELLATNERPPRALAPGRVYTFRGNRTILAYQQGAVVRLASVGATRLNMFKVFMQVHWPMELASPTRPAAGTTNDGANRGPSHRAPARVTKPAARRSRKR